MNYAIILAAGVGQRMRSGGLPKQFLKLMGKPIIVYTLEKFSDCEAVDKIIVVCHSAYVDLMKEYIELYKIRKIQAICVGGKDRQGSICNGIDEAKASGATDEDIVIIHDGVRPLVGENTIRENIRIAMQYGYAMTVHPVSESVVVSKTMEIGINDISKRDDTYSMTSPQTFKLGLLMDAFNNDIGDDDEVPMLDAAMVCAKAGKKINLVKEYNNNLKITTPEDFYYLKAMLEMEENKRVFGL
ncbi:2-C-methyl-D-erythritol 4-phosphate cytidylyltransferase [Butyrivibrio sp. YAB3001]|nr:2-C-methyl-D-erythritol 4-phosphate cytidylyltransferase [Butyrivibrio sp. YAB3001]